MELDVLARGARPGRAPARSRRGRHGRRPGAPPRPWSTGTSSPKRSRIAAVRSRSAASAGTASTVLRPTSAFNAAGVPSATMWPWSMIPTRSARTSASSRYCVVRKTVTPSSLARRLTSPQSAVRLWTSRPVVGSSRKRISRPVHERERQVEPALHPARVAAHLAVGGLAQADAAEQLVGARDALGARDPLQRGLQAQVLAAGQERVERRLLQRRADVHPHLRPLLDDVEAGHARAAGGRRQQRRQHVHGRRLARAVRDRGSRRSRQAARRGRSRRPRAGPS